LVRKGNQDLSFNCGVYLLLNNQKMATRFLNQSILDKAFKGELVR